MRTTTDELEKIQASYTWGKTVEQIAKQTGRSQTTILRLLHKSGVKMRKSGTTRMRDPAKCLLNTPDAATMRASGSTLQQIAVKYGVTRQLVFQQLNKYAGLNKRKRKSKVG